MKKTILHIICLATFFRLSAQSEPSGFQQYPKPAASAPAPRLVVPVGHSANISAAAISPDEKFVLTGSDDHTVILWNLEGKELFTYKPGTETILAVSFLYTDKDQFVVTGDAGANIVLWDFKGNRILEFGMALTRQESAGWIKKLAFSPDGKILYVKDRYGESYVNVQTGELTDPYPQPEMPITPSFISGQEQAVFSPVAGSNLVLSFQDQSATLWNMDGKKLRVFGKNNLINQVDRTAFSPVPEDNRIYISSNGQTRLWDLSIGAPTQNYSDDPVLAPDWKSVLASSKDGQKAILKSPDNTTIRTFDGKGYAFSPDGKTVATAVKDGIKLWDAATGKEQLYLKPATSGWNETGFNAVVFSPITKDDPAGGKYILTCRGSNNTVEVWSRETPQQPLSKFKAGQELQPRLDSRAFAFTPDGKSVLAPVSNMIIAQKDMLSGESVNTFEGHHDRINAVAVAPFGKNSFIVAAGSEDNTVKLWDPANNVVKQPLEMAVAFGGALPDSFVGGEIQTYKGHTSSVGAVAFSPISVYDPAGGKYVLSGSTDNTVKIWDRVSGKELCTLISFGENDWVVTSPSGLFDASAGAMHSMYFVVGTEAIELEQLKERYYEPHLLAKIFGLSADPSRSVEKFNAVALYPEMAVEISDDNLSLQVNLKARNGGMGKLSFFINGKEVLEDANPQRSATVSLNLMDYARYYLPNESNKLALRVYNKDGWLKSPASERDYLPPATARGGGSGGTTAPMMVGRPSLYAIVVGTSNYVGDKLDLAYADKDAAAFSQALRVAAPNIFNDRVNITLLNTDSKDQTRQDTSSKAAIKKAFENIAAKAKAQDVLVIYFAGHGVNYGAAEKAQFYYLTKDVSSEDLSQPEIREKRAISSMEFTEWIKSIAALKQVLVFDACQAGNIAQNLGAGRRDLPSAQIRALDRMKDRTGMFILTGSAADKPSYESTKYGQGLLTYSLLEGMRSMTTVDVMKLFQYSCDRVPELAKGIGGIQKPTLNIPTTASSFDIGLIKDSKLIPLAVEKPVFTYPRMRDMDEGDVLKLNEAIDAYLAEKTADGSQASFIYWNVPTHESGYSIRGAYAVNGDAVEVKAVLFKGSNLLNRFTVTGKKSDVPGLVGLIWDQVAVLIR